MEEKTFNEMMNEVLAELTDEQKSKIAECKDTNEVFDELGKMGIALPDEMLDGAAGGFSWKNPGLTTVNRVPLAQGGTTKQENPNPFTPNPNTSKFFYSKRPK